VFGIVLISQTKTNLRIDYQSIAIPITHAQVAAVWSLVVFVTRSVPSAVSSSCFEIS